MDINLFSPQQFAKTLTVFTDYHRSYLFRIIFIDNNIVDILPGISTSYLISSSNIPNSKTESIPIGQHGSQIKITGKTTYDDWKVNVKDDHTNIAYSYFQSWRNKIYNPKSGKAALPTSKNIIQGDGYKKKAILILLPNNTSVIRETVGLRGYTIKGIWPSEIGAPTIDYSNEGIITFPINFVIDSFDEYSVTNEILNLI